MGSSDTDYKRKMFSLCTKEAKSRSRTELGIEMKNKGIQRGKLRSRRKVRKGKQKGNKLSVLCVFAVNSI